MSLALRLAIGGMLALLPVMALAQTPTPGVGFGTPNGVMPYAGGFVWNGTSWVPATSAPPTAAGTTGTTAGPVQGVNGGVPVAVSSPVVASGVPPTVQAAAYAAGNSIGGLLSFASVARIAAGSGLIQAAVLSFTSGVQPATDLILFNANPTSSTITDMTQVAIATADVGKVVATIHITDSVLAGTTAPSLCQAQQQAVAFVLPAGTTVYAALVARAAATLTSTSDLTATLWTLQN